MPYVTRKEIPYGEVVTLVDEWTAQDIAHGCNVTEDEAIDIMEYAAAKHDANVGFNWDFFEYVRDHLGIKPQGERDGKADTSSRS